MEVKWSFWTQIGGSKSAIYISILPYIAPVMKQIHLFANKFDQSNIYDYELVFILTGSSPQQPICSKILAKSSAQLFVMTRGGRDLRQSGRAVER